MKCRFTIDVHVNPETMTDRERDKIRFRQVQMRRRVAGKTVSKMVPDPYFPAGTIYEHDNAAFFVMQGMAEPADDECAVACGMTADEIEVNRRRFFKMDNILVNDWPLYDAGVILGYSDSGEYIRGPKWDEYHAALEAEEEDSE